MSSPPLARPTVLVVDDEQGVLTLLELSLQQVGYNVICAQSGREAMEILESERGATIDLTILDYSMPGFDGIEVLRLLRSIHDSPVVLMSGYPIETIQHRLEPGEIAGFLQKPYRFEDLERIMFQALLTPTSATDDVAPLDSKPAQVLS